MQPGTLRHPWGGSNHPSSRHSRWSLRLYPHQPAGTHGDEGQKMSETWQCASSRTLSRWVVMTLLWVFVGHRERVTASLWGNTREQLWFVNERRMAINLTLVSPTWLWYHLSNSWSQSFTLQIHWDVFHIYCICHIRHVLPEHKIVKIIFQMWYLHTYRILLHCVWYMEVLLGLAGSSDLIKHSGFTVYLHFNNTQCCIWVQNERYNVGVVSP